MDILLFVFFSFFEYVAIFLLLHVLFRIPITEYSVPIIMISLLETFLSYILRFSTNLAEFSVLIQIVTMILAFKLIWKIQLHYSTIIVSVAYCLYLTIQLFIFVFMNVSGVFNINQLQREIVDGVTLLGALLQTVTVVSSIIFVVIVKMMNWGWQFVPDCHKKINYNNPLNFLLLCISLVSIVLFSSVIAIGMTGNEFLIFCLSVIQVVIMLGLITLSNKRDAINE